MLHQIGPARPHAGRAGPSLIWTRGEQFGALRMRAQPLFDRAICEASVCGFRVPSGNRRCLPVNLLVPYGISLFRASGLLLAESPVVLIGSRRLVGGGE